MPGWQAAVAVAVAASQTEKNPREKIREMTTAEAVAMPGSCSSSSESDVAKVYVVVTAVQGEPL